MNVVTCERYPYKSVEALKKKSEERARAKPGVSGGIPYLVHHNPYISMYLEISIQAIILSSKKRCFQLF